MFADPHDGLAVETEESHITTKPESAFLALIRALDCIAGQPVYLYQILMKPSEGLPVVSIHAGIFDREPDVA